MRRFEEAAQLVVDYLLDRFEAEQFFAMARWAFGVIVFLLAVLWLHLRHLL